jgi:hypothetical protein
MYVLYVGMHTRTIAKNTGLCDLRLTDRSCGPPFTCPALPKDMAQKMYKLN